MAMKASCPEHNTDKLECGCLITVLESSSDFHETLRAKDKWIRDLLDEVDDLKEKLAEIRKVIK